MLIRNLTFLFGCIGTRLLLAYLAFAFPQILPVMGVFALAIAVGFTLIYLNGWRKTGPEVMGGKIWWNALRPIHAFNYFLFAVLALSGSKMLAAHAWKVLLFDALLGLLAFIWVRLIKKLP